MGRLFSIAAAAWFAAGAWAGDDRPSQNTQTPVGARSAAATVAARSATPAAAATRPARATAARPASNLPRPSDKQLEAIIRAKFAKSKINADKFTVRVQGGVATIDGRTNVMQHKGTATRMAKTAGAVAVNNHVQISDAAKEKAAGNLEEGRRRVQIKRGDARGEPRQQGTQPAAQAQAKNTQ